MSFFNRLFKTADSKHPSEPIFPGESFSILKLNMPEGIAIATVNKAYENYSNKNFYPFLVGIELEVVKKNDNGHPLDSEAAKLNQIQEDIENLLKQKQTVHFIAKVTRNGFVDILFYIDTPKLLQKEINTFCNNIKNEREIKFSINKDPLWKAVSGFIK